MNYPDHEQVIINNLGDYKSIIALHNTSQGPALGGTRFKKYKSFSTARQDALSLSETMSYKAGFAGLPLGGGKAVLIEPENDYNKQSIFKTHAKVLNQLNGRYITAEDAGTTPGDMDVMATKTDYVLGTTGGVGDPAPMTAYGIKEAIRRTTEVLNLPSFKNLSVAIQGLGSVGMRLAKQLTQSGVSVIGTDTNQKKCEKAQEKFNIAICESDNIYDQDVDVFAPCALGGVINKHTIDRLHVDLIAGSANCALAKPDQTIKEISASDLVYLPDFTINSGGLISAARSRIGLSDDEDVKEKIDDVIDSVIQIVGNVKKAGNMTIYEQSLDIVHKRINK